MIDLPKTELLAQLAEEAAELAHAALKLRRALDGVNPTPVSITQAGENLLEELADIHVCRRALGIEACEIADIAERKMKRWRERIANAAKPDTISRNSVLAMLPESDIVGFKPSALRKMIEDL